MRAVLIDPATRTITEVSVPDESKRHLPAMYAHLGCSCVDVVRLSPDEDMWIDDEGLISYPNPRGYFRLGGAVFAGAGLILGNDGKGDITGSGLSPMRLWYLVEWLDTPAESDVEPSISVTTFEEG